MKIKFVENQIGFSHVDLLGGFEALLNAVFV